MTLDHLDRSLGHDHWATNDLLQISRNLTQEQLTQQFDIGMGCLQAALVHMVHSMDWWTQQMLGAESLPEVD